MAHLRCFASAALAAALLAAPAAHAKAPPHRLSLVNTAAARVELAAGWGVSVTPGAGLSDGDWVAVSFSSPTPSATDIVLAYAPFPSNISSTAPIEWFVCAEADANYLATGAGQLPARLINVRAPYSFAIASGSEKAPVVRAVSNAVAFANYNEPRGARIALTGAPDEMRVSWSSASASFGPAVEFSSSSSGSSSGALPAVAAAPTVVPASSSITWAAEDLCGPPATTVGFFPPGFVHSAVLTGLAPGGTYSYTVGDSTGRSQHYSFTMPTPSAFPFSISVFGDMGADSLDGSNVQRVFPPAPNTTRLVAADIASGLSHAVLHCGDLSYAMGFESAWEYLIDIISTSNVIAPRVPYFVNQGRVLKRSRGAPAHPDQAQPRSHLLFLFPAAITRRTTRTLGPPISPLGPTAATAAASAASRRQTSSPCPARWATRRGSGGARRLGRSSRSTSPPSSTRRPAARCTRLCATRSRRSTAP